MTQTSFVLLRCARQGSPFVVRFDGRKGKWTGSVAFPVEESAASRGGYGRSQLSGEIDFAPQYPGCPHCRAAGILLCGGCNRPVCWDGSKTVTCSWCRTVNEHGGRLESLDAVSDV